MSDTCRWCGDNPRKNCNATPGNARPCEYPKYQKKYSDAELARKVAAERERCARLELEIRRLLDENGPLIAVCREFIERWPTEEGIDNTIQRARAILLDHDLRSPPAENVVAAIRGGKP